MQLDSSVQFLKNVGPKLSKLFLKLGVFTIEDLLYLLPRTYEDRRKLPRISECEPDKINTVVGLIESVEERKVKKKLSVLEARITDQSGVMTAVWFNQAYLKKVLKPYTQILIKGKVEFNLFQKVKQMQVADTEMLRTAEDIRENVGYIVPAYPLTQGLYQYQIRKAISTAIEEAIKLIPDYLPAYLTRQMNLLSAQDALKAAHRPKTDLDLQKGRYRIAFEEFLIYQIRLLQKRLGRQEVKNAPVLNKAPDLLRAYIESLPYSLTNAQQHAIKDIQEDVSSSSPMNRLIQGDVGSGKTDVAVAALLMAVGTEKTGALMAPTEILATQHYIKIKKALEQLGVGVYLLKGNMRAKEKRETLEGIQKGPCIIIGTHALIEEPVMIENLGLVVVDEQHRFGVIQRLKIKKEQTPHCVFMTATPIPRTFMLTSFGDLDKTIIGEMPPGRVPPTTFYMKESNVRKAYEHCRLQLKEGFQLYIVYPLVKESEKIDLQSAMEGFEEAKETYKEFNVGLIHGKMSPDEKKSVMSQFKDNEIQVLVATTVIEVGIDVPNSTMMIIHHAERFGLSQLHQLRGRIGRGGNESQCFLVASPKTENGKQRLKAMVNTTDGFELAEIDLKIRGPGDMLGTKQSGLPDFKCGDIVKDESILLTARKVAKTLLESDPKLEKQEHLGLKRAVEYADSIVMEETLN